MTRTPAAMATASKTAPGFASASEQRAARGMLTVALALVAGVLDAVLIYGETGLPWGSPVTTAYLAVPIGIGALAGFLAYLCEVRWRLNNIAVTVGSLAVGVFAVIWLVVALAEARFSATALALGSRGALGASASDELARVTLVLLAACVAAFQPTALLRPHTAWIIVCLDWTVLIGGAVAQHGVVRPLDFPTAVIAAAATLMAIGGAHFRVKLTEWTTRRLDVAAAAIWRRLRALVLMSVAMSVCATASAFATDLVRPWPELSATWASLGAPLARINPFTAFDPGGDSSAARPGAGIGVSSMLIDESRGGQRVVLRYRVSLSDNGPRDSHATGSQAGAGGQSDAALDDLLGSEMPLSILTTYDTFANGAWSQAAVNQGSPVVQPDQPLWVLPDSAASSEHQVVVHTRYTVYPTWATPYLPALDGTVSFGVPTRVALYPGAQQLDPTRPGGYSAVKASGADFGPIGGYATYDTYSFAPPDGTALADVAADSQAPSPSEHTTLTALTGDRALDAQIRAFASQVRGGLVLDAGPQPLAHLVTQRLNTATGTGAFRLDERVRPTSNSNAALTQALATHVTNKATFLTLGVLVLRALGIPARLATGFLPGTADASTGDMVVLLRDYYAFPQILTAAGWISVPLIATPRISVRIVPDVSPTPTPPSQGGGRSDGAQATATAAASAQAGGGAGGAGGAGGTSGSRTGGKTHQGRPTPTPTQMPQAHQTTAPPPFPLHLPYGGVGGGVATVLALLTVMIVMLLLLAILIYLLWWLRHVRTPTDAAFYAFLLHLLVRPARTLGRVREPDPVTFDPGDPLTVTIAKLCRFAEGADDRQTITVCGQTLHNLLYAVPPPVTHVAHDVDAALRRSAKRRAAHDGGRDVANHPLPPELSFLSYHRVLWSFVRRSMRAHIGSGLPAIRDATRPSRRPVAAHQPRHRRAHAVSVGDR